MWPEEQGVCGVGVMGFIAGLGDIKGNYCSSGIVQVSSERGEREKRDSDQSWRQVSPGMCTGESDYQALDTSALGPGAKNSLPVSQTGPQTSPA